jgi:hypothetical protein
MSSESVETRPALPQDDFAATLLTAEFEPTADGSQRALLYPDDENGPALATHWIAASASVLVDLDAVR